MTDALEPKRTCLLFFDTTNTFVNGPSLTSAGRSGMVETAVRNWVRLLAAARERRMMVAYASTEYRADEGDYYRRIADTDMRLTPLPEPGMRQTMPPHISDTARVAVIDEIVPQPGDYVIRKARWSPFFQTPLELSLRTQGIDTIVVAGGSTEIGIAATAYAAQALDFDLVVVSDATTSNHADCHEMFMRKVFPRFARVRTTDQVISMLETP